MTRTDNNVFEEKIGKVFFVVEAKNMEKGKETAEEKLKNIMIKDLIANDNTMLSIKHAETVDFQGFTASKESFEKSPKMA